MKVNVLHTAVDCQSTVAADCTNSSNSPWSCPLVMGDSGISTVLTRYESDIKISSPKLKEPLRGTQYNTRDELIHTIGWSIWNINKDGSSDGVTSLPNIWQKVRNTEYIVLFCNANPLHYYALRFPRKVDRWHWVWTIFLITHRLGRPHYVWDEYMYKCTIGS